jgi:hypothetical protein
MITMLVPLTVAAVKKVAKTLSLLVMITMNVPVTAAIRIMDAVLIVSFVTITICVLEIAVAQNPDATTMK